MSGNSLFLDTNIVLYLLAGDETLAEMLNEKDVHVSFITEMELLSYKQLSAAEEKKIYNFLADAQVADLTQPIKQKAIAIRKATGMKLPDSIIAATAIQMNIPLLTADAGFSKITALDHLHYQK
jgi:predicted nucleic acid-binding protein